MLPCVAGRKAVASLLSQLPGYRARLLFAAANLLTRPYCRVLERVGDLGKLVGRVRVADYGLNYAT